MRAVDDGGPDFDQDAGQTADASTIPPETLAKCIEKKKSSTGRWAGDAGLILEYAGISKDDAIALVTATGHSVTARLDALPQLVIDVGTSSRVFEWACRYTLDPTYRGKFVHAWANGLSTAQ